MTLSYIFYQIYIRYYHLFYWFKGEKNSSGITTTVSSTNHGIVGEKRCYGNVDNENGQSSSFVLPVRNSNGSLFIVGFFNFYSLL